LKTAGIVIGLWLGWGALRAQVQRVSVDTLQESASQLVLKQKVAMPDSLPAVFLGKDTLKKKAILPPKLSPRKSTLYSLAFPGLGQAYNKQYWKMPFVYAGIGAIIYFLHDNNARYKHFLGPFLDSYDPTTGLLKKGIDPRSIEVYVKSQDQIRKLTLEQITRGKDIYRRYRDLNWFLLAGSWALVAIEANVSAHLKTFDMSDDISLRVCPEIQLSPLSPVPVWGVRAVLTFK